MSKSKTRKLVLEELPPRIVVKFHDNLKMPYTSKDEISGYMVKNQILPLKALKKKFPGIELDKLFTSVEPDEIVKSAKEAAKLSRLKPGYQPPNFLTYFVIDCPYTTNTDHLLQALLANKNVSYAYVQSDPAVSPGVATRANPGLRQQGYLNPATSGIDAKYAWKFEGGCGEGNVKFIDIEYAWILDHEDIKDANVKFIWGKSDYAEEKDHGTNVLGIILMQDNSKGGLGITHANRNAGVISQKTPGGAFSIADAIEKAISKLDFGDVLLLETQVYNRRLGWLLPAETERGVFEKIEEATNRGIIVIEAAGNGDEIVGFNLDDYIIRGKKVLDRNNRDDFKDSGAIIVGASSGSPAHGKRKTSNYGSRIDCFAWGNNVYTADDPANHTTNDPADEPSDKEPYTQEFSGTSSASAIIAGAAIAIQSILEANGQQRLDAIEMREILSNRVNGTTSSTNNIGVMPDLKKIIDNVIPGLP